MNEYMSNIMRGIKMADAVDILIIAAFIYLILLWFKKARARFMLIGMLIISAVYILARVFRLYLTIMAFQAFFAIALIMIVVIFQDDFRRFLEKIAVFGMTRTHRRQPSYAENVEILASAVASLARKKIGALIAVQGKDPFERHLEAGIALDGLLSQVLLESIFDKHVPSHDGAVVIEGGRITRFGCHLPLSTNVKEVGRQGTRHAAALGLAERTDALCLVVSEEEGTVSVAEDGKIRKLKELTHVGQAIDSFYKDRFPKKEGITISSFFASHILEKVVAIILACTLWLAFSHRAEMIRRDFVVPIEYRNLGSDMMIGEANPKQVVVTLSGSERAFNLLDPKDLKLSIDMSAAKEGENKIPFSKESLRTLSGISVLAFDPDAMYLSVQRMVQCSIPVEVKTKGHVKQGYAISEIKVEPAEMAVVIPSTTPKDRISIFTKPIDVSNMGGTVTLTPELLFPSNIRFPDDDRQEVKVTIKIEKKQ